MDLFQFLSACGYWTYGFRPGPQKGLPKIPLGSQHIRVLRE